MEDIITSYNKQSTILIKSQKYQQAFQILMKCIKLLESIKETQLSYRLLSTTYSNFSALYKETGKLPESNKFLLKVIEIEKKLPTNKINSINAYLSLCSNFSSLNDHEVALRYGLTGLMLLQKEFPLPEVLVPITVIAYHNVGVEYEYLSKVQDAVDSYYKGWTLAKTRLGLTHSLTLSIKNSFLASSQSNRLPDVSMRTNSQYAYKRPDLADQSIHTGSTSSSGTNAMTGMSANAYKLLPNENRKILTPRAEGRNKWKNLNRLKPKIDLFTQRANEKNAAVVIQAWWKGVLQRRRFSEVKMKLKLKQAAVKAQAAYNEFKYLKEQFSKKKLVKIDKTGRGVKAEARVRDGAGIRSGKSKSIDFQRPLKNTKADSAFRQVNKSGEDLPTSLLVKTNQPQDKIMEVKSTNNQIPSLKSRTKKKHPISLQQFHKLHLDKILKIQSFCKMVGTRAKYEKIRSAVIIIQKNYRMYICYKLFKTISSSITKLKGDFMVYRQRFLNKSKIHS